MIVKGPNALAPVLTISRPVTRIRTGRAIDPVTISYHDDLTAPQDLTVSIAQVPAHLKVSSVHDPFSPGAHELLFSLKDPAWTGSEMLTVSVTDEDGLTTTQTITIEIVSEANQAPAIKAIPQVFALTDSMPGEGGYVHMSMAIVLLQPFVEDDYDAMADMTLELDQQDADRLMQQHNVYAVAGGGSITITDGELQKVRNAFTETLHFTITDRDGGVSTGQMPVQFPKYGNDLPTLHVADRYYVKGSSGPLRIDLSNYMADDMNRIEDLLLDPVADTENFHAVLNGHVLDLTPKASAATGITDALTLVLREPNNGLMINQATLHIVLQEGTAPLISNIARQDIALGTSFAPIDLHHVVYDDNTLPENIQWSFQGQQHLQATVTNGVLQIAAVDPTWRGVETLHLVATDSEGKSSMREATFSIYSPSNTAPVISIASQYVSHSTGFAPIDLRQCVQDDATAPENITWTITPVDARLLVNRQGHIVTITAADPAWRGVTSIEFRATDAEERTAIQYAAFAVDYTPPVVKPLPEVIRNLGVNFLSLDLNGYITDDVTPFDNLGIHIVKSPPHLQAELDYYEPLKLVTLIAIPTPGWTGSETVELKVIDGDNLETTFSVTFTIVEKTYTVSGIISDGSGSPLPNVQLGGFTTAVNTDAAGQYTTTVPAGRTLTLTPALAGYTFTPANHTINTLAGNETINFTGTYQPGPPTYSLSGYITDATGSALGGVALNGFSTNVTTDASGYYHTTEAAHWKGTIIPAKTGYTFNPISHTVTDLTYESTLNYSATYVGTGTYNLSGTVMDETGTPLPGVTISGFTQETVTDGSGNYALRVPTGWSGTLLATKDGYAFTPAQIVIAAVNADRAALNFTASPINGTDESARIAAIHPNPSAGRFSIPLPATGRATAVQIYSGTGVIVQEKQAPAGTAVLEVTLEAKGIYLVRIVNGGSTYLEKVIIR